MELKLSSHRRITPYIVSRRDWLSNGVVFKTEVLHFSNESTLLKDTNEKGKFK